MAISKSSNYQNQSLERAFQMLDVMACHPDGVSVTTMSEKLRLPKATAHRLLMVLEAKRFAEKDLDSGRYQLGPRFLELGRTVHSRKDIYTVGRPHLRKLMEESCETAHIGKMRHRTILCLASVPSKQALHAPVEVGTQCEAYCSSLGKAILAFAEEQELEAYLDGLKMLPFTRNTITSADLLRRDLELVRRNGYAIDDEEFEEGLRCIAAPIRDASGHVMAAISISGPVFRITRDRIKVLADKVIEHAARVSASFGYVAPPTREDEIPND